MSFVAWPEVSTYSSLLDVLTVLCRLSKKSGLIDVVEDAHREVCRGDANTHFPFTMI